MFDFLVFSQGEALLGFIYHLLSERFLVWTIELKLILIDFECLLAIVEVFLGDTLQQPWLIFYLALDLFVCSKLRSLMVLSLLLDSIIVYVYL